jgi:hypothetical protein
MEFAPGVNHGDKLRPTEAKPLQSPNFLRSSRSARLCENQRLSRKSPFGLSNQREQDKRSS